MPGIKYEIACFDYESAVLADKAGADRIELCHDKSAGGVTPSRDVISKAKNNIKIPVNVIIRPGGGVFCYSDSEFELMKEDIIYCKSIGINGVVFGILSQYHSIDVERNKVLVELAKPMQTTFHRAFDHSIEQLKGLEDIISCGFNRILTSGCKENAAKGAAWISELIKMAGKRIIIMPGGGIRKENITYIYNSTNAFEFHSSSTEIINSITK
ncbi:MAG: copper homeostasis protein CutC [Ignavibacteria bacterium]|nr:copper homeostasis protein CutC [Ignavibacteria bacterium]